MSRLSRSSTATAGSLGRCRRTIRVANPVKQLEAELICAAEHVCATELVCGLGIAVGGLVAPARWSREVYSNSCHGAVGVEDNAVESLETLPKPRCCHTGMEVVVNLSCVARCGNLGCVDGKICLVDCDTAVRCLSHCAALSLITS